jgi:hypothetical protein
MRSEIAHYQRIGDIPTKRHTQHGDVRRNLY